MMYDYIKGECENCGENDVFVIIPHGQEEDKGTCFNCLEKLKKEPS